MIINNWKYHKKEKTITLVPPGVTTQYYQCIPTEYQISINQTPRYHSSLQYLSSVQEIRRQKNMLNDTMGDRVNIVPRLENSIDKLSDFLIV